MAGDLKLKYGTANQTITITLASLANAALAVSNEISNTSDLFMDVGVQVKIKTGSSGTSATGVINVYVIGSADTGTSYSSSANQKTVMIGSFNAVADATTYISNVMSIVRAMGFMPEKYKVIVENLCGSTLSATGGDHAAIYQGSMAQYT